MSEPKEEDDDYISLLAKNSSLTRDDVERVLEDVLAQVEGTLSQEAERPITYYKIKALLKAIGYIFI